jgi:hypothetical protein
MRDKIVERPILEKFSEIFLTTKLWSKNILIVQIDRQLEILKIEKEISYQKLLVFKTKDSLAPKNIVSWNDS